MKTATVLAFLLTALLPVSASPKKSPGTKKDGVLHVDAKEAATLLAEPNKDKRPTILDIRTPAEFSGGHLKDAKNIDFRSSDFETNLGKLDKDKPYLVHCRSGGRSGSSLEIFKKLGFKRIIHLDGGILAWKEAKLPVTAPAK